jgi:hypothetical protein
MSREGRRQGKGESRKRATKIARRDWRGGVRREEGGGRREEGGGRRERSGYLKKLLFKATKVVAFKVLFLMLSTNITSS